MARDHIINGHTLDSNPGFTITSIFTQLGTSQVFAQIFQNSEQHGGADLICIILNHSYPMWHGP